MVDILILTRYDVTIKGRKSHTQTQSMSTVELIRFPVSRQTKAVNSCVTARERGWITRFNLIAASPFDMSNVDGYCL